MRSSNNSSPPSACATMTREFLRASPVVPVLWVGSLYILMRFHAPDGMPARIALFLIASLSLGMTPQDEEAATSEQLPKVWKDARFWIDTNGKRSGWVRW